MFDIAICDDENSICSGLEEMLETVSPKYNIKFNIDVFYNAESLYEKLTNGFHYDLIFLDIELGNMSGVDLGRKLRDEIDNQITQIVYISSKSSYAMKLFSIRPLDFLIKPITIEKIDRVLNTISKLIKSKAVFIYNKDKKDYIVPISNIYYFESDKRKIKIYTKDKVDIFYGSLKEVYKKLKKSGFIFINRSYLININHVKIFKYDEVTLVDDTRLNISQTYRKKVRDMQLKLGGI